MGRQQPERLPDRALLERYTKIDFFRLEFEKIVHKHELIDHMKFNDDQIYKDLMNEVQALNASYTRCSLLLHSFLAGVGCKASTAFQIGGHHFILVLQYQCAADSMIGPSPVFVQAKWCTGAFSGSFGMFSVH